MKVSILIAVMASFLMSACTTPKIISDVISEPEPNEGPCPQALVLWDAARKVQIGEPEVFTNVGFTGEILKVRSVCSYVGTDPIIADLEIDFAFGRGPAALGMVADFSYFVAVTRTDRAVISKEFFPLQVEFNSADEIVYVTESFESITIPRKQQNTSGINFEIIVGFELTEDELKFSRSGKRFRVNAGLR